MKTLYSNVSGFQHWKFALIMLLNHIEKVAEKGHIESIYNLGIGYRYGIGTETNVLKSYNKAAEKSKIM
ncbi:hypothetical protein GLOIN_2v1780316 [Rhizophagus irregularis DAOM 181602=DAOM 197198]|uniref:Sel1 repeat family protein n=1 Tax=Rhizophagus irregularis TaxID=588596 RepID=A0A2N1NZJ2_9GLOM|nr:hypothetical protein RhiirC2_769310 [Rhizophagus irregularis]GET64967.1 hypothetical protein GLOIN_2v1780316 [Rhizophagus irregularis DAOM 181602=DAOM 197198]